MGWAHDSLVVPHLDRKRPNSNVVQVDMRLEALRKLALVPGVASSAVRWFIIVQGLGQERGTTRCLLDALFHRLGKRKGQHVLASGRDQVVAGVESALDRDQLSAKALRASELAHSIGANGLAKRRVQLIQTTRAALTIQSVVHKVPRLVQTFANGARQVHNELGSDDLAKSR